MSKNLKTSEIELLSIMEDFFQNGENSFIKKTRKKKDNSKNGDMFLNCRSCKATITTDYRSRMDTRYCADCL